MTTTQDTRPLRAALVGAGGLGRAWTGFILKEPSVDLVAVVDPLVGTDNQAPWIAEDLGHLPAETALSALAAHGVEAVIVTAFSTAHHAVVKEALEAGLHVLVEKPFTTSLAEAEELVALAADRGLTLMVSQNYRYFPGTALMREIVADRRYGDIAAVFCRFDLDWPGKPYQHGMQHAMGLEMGIHHFDLCRAIFDAEAVGGHAREWQPANSQYAGGGAIEALFDMKGGAGTFPFTYSGNLVSRAPRTPWPGQWRFDFDLATVVLDTVDGRYGLYAYRGEEAEWLDRFDGETMLFDRPLTHFTRSIAEGSEPWSSGRDNLGTLRMALGAETFGTSA